MPMQHWAHSIQSAFGTHNSTLAVIVTRSLAARLGQWSCFRFAMCVGGVGGNASWQDTARAHFRGMLFPKIKAFLRRQLGPTRFYVALSSRFQEAAPEEDSGEKAWLAKMLLVGQAHAAGSKSWLGVDQRFGFASSIRLWMGFWNARPQRSPVYVFRALW